MVRILHAGGFQLGRQFDGIGRGGDTVRKALKESLELSVKQALERGVDLFVVSGDLFSTNLVSRHLVGYVYHQVERLGRIPFVVLPGCCDPLDGDSIYRHLPPENRPDNLFILNEAPVTYLNFPDSEISVYGVPYRGRFSAEEIKSLMVRKGVSGTHVAVIPALASGADSAESQAGTVEFLEQSGFDYIAVGGSTSFRNWGAKTFSCGSPEALSFEEADAGQALLVDVGQGSATVEKIPIGQLTWKLLELDNTNFRYNIEIEEELDKHAGALTLLRVRVNADYFPDGFLDLPLLERNHREHFCYLEIVDDRKFDPRTLENLSAAPGTLGGDYIQLLKDAIKKAPPELEARYLQAAFAGIALLSGKDVI